MNEYAKRIKCENLLFKNRTIVPTKNRSELSDVGKTKQL